MPITKGYQQLVEDARRKIRTIGIEEAMSKHGDPDVVFVDLRDVRELEREGMVPGAFHAPRGMLEFCELQHLNAEPTESRANGSGRRLPTILSPASVLLLPRVRGKAGMGECPCRMSAPSPALPRVLRTQGRVLAPTRPPPRPVR